MAWFIMALLAGLIMVEDMGGVSVFDDSMSPKNLLHFWLGVALIVYAIKDSK